jgi:hypothetical protein
MAPAAVLGERNIDHHECCQGGAPTFAHVTFFTPSKAQRRGQAVGDVSPVENLDEGVLNCSLKRNKSDAANSALLVDPVYQTEQPLCTFAVVRASYEGR